MNLIDESFEYQEKKDTKKTKKILIISVIILVILMLVIACVIIYIENKTLKAIVDNKTNATVTALANIDDNGVLYFPIKAIAESFGYASFNGEYKGAYETQNQCYVKCEDEIANFTVNSSEVYKLELDDENSNYEKYIAERPVKYQNGQLYASEDAIEKAFNVSIKYDANKNRIYIKTMPYLIESFKELITSKGYKEISKDFTNQKAVLNGELVVEKDDRTFAVISTSDGKEILDPKYDNIEFIPETGEFLVKLDDKVGIMKINNENKAETKIQTAYTNLEIIDSTTGLYLAQKDDKFGVIDSKENKKIYIEYDKIGIDANDFEKNGIKNNYLIVDNFILVQKDKQWAVFNKKGKQLTDFKYDSFGYKAKTSKDIYSLLVIPDYNVLVACKDKKYILIDSTGEELFRGVSFDDIYITISAEKISYKLSYNDKTYDVVQQLKKQGVNETANDKSEDSDSENDSDTDENKTKQKNKNTSNTNTSKN